jgi:hypothetical protein
MRERYYEQKDENTDPLFTPLERFAYRFLYWTCITSSGQGAFYEKAFAGICHEAS